MNPRKWSKPKRFLAGVGGLLVFLIILGSVFGSNPTPKTKTVTGKSASTLNRPAHSLAKRSNARAETGVNRALRDQDDQAEEPTAA